VPVSPDDGGGLGRRVLALYQRAVQELLGLLARRITRRMDRDNAPTVPQEVAEVRRDAEEIVGRLGREAVPAVAEAVRAGHDLGVTAAAADLKAAGNDAAAAAGAALGDLAHILEDAKARTRALDLQVLRATTDAYQRSVVDATARVLDGSMTRRQASAQVVARLGEQGLTVTDSRGRRWETGAFAEMSVRTAAGQAAVQGHVDRLRAAGHDLVVVSDAPQECHLCRPWESKVLSLGAAGRGDLRVSSRLGDGMVTVHVAGTLAEATAAGLFHPQCRHRLAAFLPGVTKPPTHTEDPEGDRLRQRQRALERQVRAAKRQALALKEARDAALATSGRKRLPVGDPIGQRYRQALARQRASTARHDEFVAEHDLKRLSYRLNLKAR
jgi:hypothetical protein